MAIACLCQWVVWVFSLGRREARFTMRVVRILSTERTFCIGKIKGRVGYRARFTTEEGLGRAVGWYMRDVYEMEKKREMSCCVGSA